MMTPNYRLTVSDLNGSTSMDAEQWGAQNWRYTGPGFGGMLIANRANMVTALANLIGEGKAHRITFPGGAIWLDRLGGTWGYNEDRYYPVAELICLLVPEEAGQ